MKIDKRNPRHWWWLILFGMTVLLSLVLRPFVSRKARIMLYGHKLNGNIKAIYLHWIQAHANEAEICFLTMDREYANHLTTQGINCLDVTRFSSAKKLAQCRLFISTHGLHCLSLLLYSKTAKFVDVWHGIPFKGFDADDFRIQHRFDEIWVSSTALKTLYVERFGFDESKVFCTGYARTDLALHPDPKLISEIKSNLGLPEEKKVVLFAPTWKQDAAKRSIFPFGADEQTFLRELNEACQQNNTIALLRTHLNSADKPELHYSNIILAPASDFPDTEEILSVCDLLICDWSSIAFDYLVLDRPTIFLEVSPPFQKGFSLPPDDRFGAVACSLNELFRHVEEYLNYPENYWSEHHEKINRIKSKIYDSNADGKTASRCCQRAVTLLK